MPHKTDERLRMKISELNNIHISKPRQKQQFLCKNSSWKHNGNNELIHNISNIQFSTVVIEALQFGLKFATEINSLNIINLIDINYRHNDSDF